ncbi:glycosyltransferase family 2 protein [Stieleria sp. ICT_E10.1]|uniref:glycosyltransferase family 2 protein n=1 Tax=Stieleria sedimenti TaxID=2976331 RepID=UPI00217F2C15|nr:glycosyltransferase family 2 protein [Stieleria sedimenti]MCS7465778.1 glycosyltransferase family 2 protein [Stieleria sedimenti]
MNELTKKNITVVILTKNEANHLRRALDSIQAISDEVFVIDSYSTDDTVKIAEDFGAVVLQNKFINQAKQFQWAMDHANITSQWVLRLDADEIIEPDLQDEILRRVPALAQDVVGVNFKRKHIFMGRWVRHGGRYPLVMTRLFRRGHGHVEDRWMDEHLVVSGGRTVLLEGGFADHNLNDLSYFTDKHNKYATREAVQVLGDRLGLLGTQSGVTRQNSSFQASAKRVIKERVYNRIPFTISALAYFLYRYIIQFGFLDGRSGLVYHFLQGYWYRFLVGAKLMELERAVAHLDDRNEILQELSRLTGLDLGTDFESSECSPSSRSEERDAREATLSSQATL